MTARAFDPAFGRGPKRGTAANKRMPPEQMLQRACADFLRRCVPPAPIGPVWTAINPVPAKSAAVAGICKAMGLVAGWPDMLLIWRGRPVLPEFKAPGGRLSPAQRALHADIAAAGGIVAVITSLEEFTGLLSSLGVPMHARVQV